MNEALIKELVKKRGHIKSRLTKFSGYIRELAEKVLCAAQVTELQLRIAKLECVYNTYDEIQTKLECMAEDDEAQLNERSDFEDLYYSSVAAARELVTMHTKVAPSDGGSEYNTRRHPHIKSRTVSHTITSLEVPRWTDPNKEAELRCQYSRQHNDPALHSVKWYRGTHEIFRYTPHEYESTQTFNESVTNSSCNLEECTIVVRPERGTAKYTCEVSSEGPRFAVDRRAANMTLAVLPEYDPLITGLPTLVQTGEQALINCTSDYSLPAATIDWFVDSEPQEDPLITHPTHISGPDSEGLRASWRTLRIYPDDYETHRGYLALRCRATVPTRPPNIRAMSVRLYVATRPHISTYMFSKNKAAAGCARHRLRSEMIVWTLLLLARRRVPLLRD